MPVSNWRQLKLLVYKNFLLKKRDYQRTLLELVYPLYFGVILVVISATATPSATYETPPVEPLPPFTCENCIPLLYAPNTLPYTEVVNSIATANGFTLADALGFASGDEMTAWVLGGGQESAGLQVFASVVFEDLFTYTLNYNLSSTLAANSSTCLLGLQAAVDEAIVRTGLNTSISCTYSTQQLATLPFQFNVGAVLYPMYFSMAFFAIMIHMAIALVSERETKIKEGMLMMGMRRSMYILSFFITQGIIALASILPFLILAKFGKIMQHSNYVLVTIFFQLYAFNLIIQAAIVSVFFNKKQTVSSAMSFAILPLVGIQVIAQFVIFPLHSPFRGLSALIPQVSFGQTMVLLYEYEAAGVGLNFGNLRDNGPFSSGTFLLYQLLSIVLGLVVVWYLDEVVSGEYGSSRNLFFFTEKGYWAPTKVRDSESASLLLNGNGQSRENDVRISVSHLRKVFPRGNVVAVEDLSVSMMGGEVFVLVGTNGAGKSTTISILTGLYGASSGDATVVGYSVKSDMSAIRKVMGVCPQQDVLFPSLTAREHLYLFGGLKGLSATEVETNSGQLLRDLDLADSADTVTKGYSGGMKRKLCFLIALMGNNEVIFLDEPSSGVDPYSRRKMWDLLADQKAAGKCIVLTTHSMEEADSLGDRIAVMMHGRLQCVGTSLALKTQFGCGYILTLAKGTNYAGSAVTGLINKHVPDAVLHSELGTQVVYHLPYTSSNRFGALFKEMDNSQGPLGFDSYGISLTTLEEVFLRLVDEEKKKRETPETPADPVDEADTPLTRLV